MLLCYTDHQLLSLRWGRVPVPCADLQPSSHPGASPCHHAHLASLCPGCSIRPHSESLSATQPFRVLHTVRSPSLETWRSCSPHRAHCSWEHPLHCFVPHFFFICAAFCAWTPTIYSVEGKAALQEGSLKKLWEFFGFACMGSTNVIEEMKPLRITKILGLPWIFGRPHARSQQPYIGTTPLQSPEICWLVPSREPGLRWGFGSSLKWTSLHLPWNQKICVTQNKAK